MRDFRFRLATLLQLREATRDERQAALSEAFRVDEVLRRQSETVAEELGRLQTQCRAAAGPGTVDVDRLVEAHRYELALRIQDQKLQRQREAVAEEIERRQQALVEANREVRVLEKLREKQAGRHRAELQRRERKQMDEAAVQRACREEVV